MLNPSPISTEEAHSVSSTCRAIAAKPRGRMSKEYVKCTLTSAITNAASSFTSWVATSRNSTTTTSLTPKGTLFSLNNLSTRAGSLAIIRAMAESVDSDTLKATTCVFWVLSSFTTSSIAPTLLGRKTENCFTSGPSIFDVVSGNLTVIGQRTAREGSHGRAGQLSHSR